MNFTGERPVYNSSSELRSRALYGTAYKFIENKNVLDYGCGVGCGINILEKYAHYIVGYDHDAESIKEAQSHYEYIPFYIDNGWESENIDIIVCLEVIEHMEKEDLQELFSKMRDYKIEGYFSTPNGNLFPYHPRTVEERRGFHVWHYTYDELKELFSPFKNYDIFGLEWDGNYGSQGAFVTYGIYCIP